MMGKPARRWWLLTWAGLVAASLACLALLGSDRTLPSALRDPMSWFVSPGVTVGGWSSADPFARFPRPPLAWPSPP